MKIGCLLAAILYITAGTLHFLIPNVYMTIMPPYIPWHLPMVYLSGACEILGGLGLLIQPTRRAAAWGLIALLIAVFPANLYMATNFITYARLPLQLLLIWWLVPYTKMQQRSTLPN